MKDVNIWYCSTKDLKKELDSYKEKLSERRIVKIHRIKPVEEKKRSVCGGILMQKFLEVSGLKEDDILVTENGKAYCKAEKEIAFNLSHSGEYVVLAFVKKEEQKEPRENGEAGEKIAELQIGVDLQEVKETHGRFGERVLSEEEKKDLKGKNLIQYWCIKEAYSKLTGKGLSTDFRNLNCDFQKGICENIKEEEYFYFKEFQLQEKYFGAVCLNEELGELHFQKISLE